MILVSFLPIAAIAAVILIGAEKRTDAEDFLSLEQSDRIKGLACVILALAHASHYSGGLFTIAALRTTGYLYVSVFLFYSAFGTTKKSIQSEQYARSGIWRRLFKLYKLVILSGLIYYPAFIYIYGIKFDPVLYIKSIVGIQGYNGALWTVHAMLVMMLAIYLFKLVFKKLSYSWAAFFSIIVYRLTDLMFSALTHVDPQPFYVYTPCFGWLAGAFVAEHEEAVREALFNKKTWLRVFLSSLIVFAICYIMPYAYRIVFQFDSSAVRIIFGNIASASFCILTLCCLRYVKIENRFSTWSGKIYTEVYIFHALFYMLSKHFRYQLFEGYIAAVSSLAITLGVMLFSTLLVYIKKNIRSGRRKLRVNN